MKKPFTLCNKTTSIYEKDFEKTVKKPGSEILTSMLIKKQLQKFEGRPRSMKEKEASKQINLFPSENKNMEKIKENKTTSAQWSLWTTTIQ